MIADESVGAAMPSVFDAGLPALSYDVTESPHDVYPRIRAAQEVASIAIGPLGPEVLSYDLARAILRDPLKILSRRMLNPRRVGPAPWKPLLGMSGPTSLNVEFDNSPL